MSLKKIIQSALSRLGYAVVKESILFDWQKGILPSPRSPVVPDDAAAYLTVNNSRLVELKERYNTYQSDASIAIVWTDEYVKSYDLLSFRGDNCYVWQSSDPNCDEINYCLTTYYVQSVDTLNLFDTNEEDGLFGVNTLTVNSKRISRDLLDSINEINFLERELEISKKRNLTILDIGAGYGRVAYRAISSLSNISSYICTDAVPESTFISEYHIKFRGIADKVKVIPLDEIEAYLQNQKVDLALNIHSFSECSLDAIGWWVELLARNEVQYLFIVPNGSDHGGEKLALNSGEDFSFILDKYGYALTRRSPKYLDPMVQKFGVSPSYYYIFELTRK